MDQKVEVESELGKTFAEALMRVMRVAGRNDEDEPAPVTQEALARRAGVSQANIKRYVNGEGASAKLSTIERIANGLGVPPAFLIMRRQDWVALASAVEVMKQAWDADIAVIEEEGSALSPSAAAAAGIAFMRRTKVLQSHKPFQPRETDALLKRIEKCVATTSGTPPYGQLHYQHRDTVLGLCAFVGTTTINDSDKGKS